MREKNDVNKERVKRIQEFAMKYPSFYRLGMLALALLGYAYIFSIIAIVSLAIVILIYLVLKTDEPKKMLRLVLPLLGLILIAVKTLWVTIPEPYGISLERSKGEKIFDMIEELGREMGCPKIHRVLINHNFSVSIVQTPLLGLFGLNKNHLILGLPMMMALDSEEFKAILAREFSPISRSYGGFESWIYRIREIWLKVMEGIEEKEGREALLYRWFFDWYVPLFSDYSLILIRQKNFAWDKLAAEVSSSNSIIRALVRESTRFELLEEIFWPSIFDKANYQSNPPTGVYYDMENFLEEDHREKEQEYLDMALQEDREDLNTKPSLKERTNFFKEQAIVPKNGGLSAAKELLGESHDGITSVLNEIWRESALESWKERHEFIMDAARRSIELSNRSRKENLSKDERWELCYLTEELKGGDEALSGYEEFYNEYPEFIPANFALGRLLLTKMNERGVELIERAMAEDYEYTIEGCRLIHNYLYNSERAEEAKQYYERAIEHTKILDLAEGERKNLEMQEIYIPHDLSEADVDKILKQLSIYPEIKEAYLVKKDVEHLKNKPLYALGVVLKKPWYSSKANYIKVVDKIAEEVQFQGETLITYLNDENSKLRKIMAKVTGAKIYDIGDK